MPEVRTAIVSVADRADRDHARGSAHFRVRTVRLRRDRRRPVQLTASMSAFGGKADMACCAAYVCF
jgi:hypothetical protein